MSKYTRQYTKFLRPEKRIPRSEIRPRNIYRIVTYKGGQPANKQGEDARYVFALGIIHGKLHCIKINNIVPLHFTQLIGGLRDKRIPLSSDLRLELMLKKYSKDGSQLFTSKIKNNAKVYSRKLANYRTYHLENITNVFEIRFEQEVLEALFGEKTTPPEKREILKDEQADLDEGNTNSLIE
tara:strand:- start:209 stop:754 length:546 start_codon:yes stop_codon:yes gene_type:complete